MSKEKSITESEAEKIIKENEEKIDGTKQKKAKENKKNKEKEDKKEGFIGTNSDPNRSPGERVVNTIIMGLNVLAMAMLFLWIPSYLWVTLSEYRNHQDIVAIKYQEQIHLNLPMYQKHQVVLKQLVLLKWKVWDFSIPENMDGLILWQRLQTI